MDRKIKRLNARFGNDYTYLKKSTIRNAGLGVFAKTDISEGIRLCEYKGQIITATEAAMLPPSKQSYLFEIKVRNGENLFVDARLLKHSNWSRFTNGIKKRHQKKKENIRYYQYKQKIWLKTMRHIKKDEELICDYGDYYWSEN